MTAVFESTAFVTAIVVSYNPSLDTFERLLDALRNQVDRVLVVDNGSSVSTLSHLEQLTTVRGIDVLRLGANLGIAAAQNHGAREALRFTESTRHREAEYLLFFDHDSIPEPQMVRTLVSADLSLRAQGLLVGAIGPVPVDRRSRTPANFICARGSRLERRLCGNDEILSVEFLISSGTLIRSDVWRRIGPMNEGLFIDHVDTEWCLRALIAGFRLYAAGAARLMHSLGDDVAPVWFGRWREVFVHSPVRDYYIVRNTILLLRQVPMRLAWRIFLFRRLVMFAVFFGAVVPPRGDRLRLMMAGVRDGLRGRSGRLSGL
jgi:rhamnosyltransferase